MAYREPFTEEEQKQLAEAHAIRQRVRAARRKRQEYCSEIERINEEYRKRIVDEKAAKAKELKDAYNERIRKVLIQLTICMREQDLRLLALDGSFGDQRLKTFRLTDAQGKQPDADIYWVNGLGFEWNV